MKTTIAPFKAFYYSKTAVSDLSDVIVPPYDNIPKEDEPKYLNRSPYNFAHIILPKKEDELYRQTNDKLLRWKKEGIFAQDTTPGYYLYQQKFELDGKTYHRHTLMCLVLLHDFSEAIVRPHENTYGQYKLDRLQLLRQTQCNLSHIFAMVNDPEGTLASKYEQVVYEKPMMVGSTDEGVDHAVWKIHGPAIDDITKFFADRPIYIVDGHHRYESSLTYAREQNAVGKLDNPAAYMLFAIANTYDPALVVLPTHRIVSGLAADKLKREHFEKTFELSPFSPEAMLDFVKKSQNKPQFGVYFSGQLYLATARSASALEADMGPTLSQNAVVWSDYKLIRELCGVPDADKSKHIFYEKDPKKAWEKRHGADLIVFHAPLPIDSITKVADEKRFMPQKTTFFYPKLAAGLIMRDHKA